MIPMLKRIKEIKRINSKMELRLIPATTTIAITLIVGLTVIGLVAYGQAQSNETTSVLTN